MPLIWLLYLAALFNKLQSNKLIQLAIGKYFPAKQTIWLHKGTKLLAAYSHTPIAEGKARVLRT